MNIQENIPFFKKKKIIYISSIYHSKNVFENKVQIVFF